MWNRSISSDRIRRIYSDCLLWWAAVAHRDLWWWSNRQATERIVWSPAWNSRCRQIPAVRTRNLPEFRCCNCRTCEPRRCAMVPTPIHRIQDMPVEVVEEAVAEGNNSPSTASGTRDHRQECRPVDNRSTASRCNDSRSDAMHQTGNNTCSQYRSRHWVRSWPADRLWWILRNTESAERLRKCNRFWWFPPLMRHKSPVHRRHIGCRSLWFERSRSLRNHSTTRHTIRNTELGWWLSMMWTLSKAYSRCDAAHRLPLLRAWDRVSAADRNNCWCSVRLIDGFHPAPVPSA